MKRLLLALLLALSLTSAAKLSLALEAPTLMTDNGTGKPEPLQLTRVATDVKIHGWLAETRVTMTFGNHHNRPVAGDLYFPLPDGATVSGYALDVNGVMVDGVAVEKEKARIAYEEEVRHGIDPGLVEAVKGNSFKTRIFPIPAHGSRTVMVRYVSRLLDTPKGAKYGLPLHYSLPVRDFSIHIEVVKNTTEPVVMSSAFPKLNFGKWRDSFVAEARMVNVTPREPLMVTLPNMERVPVAVEKDVRAGTRFVIADSAPVPAAGQSKPPRAVTIYWDASGSRGEVSHEQEFKLLSNYFKRCGNDVKVNVVLFSDKAATPYTVTVHKGNATRLLDFLKSVDYDGGTNLGAITPLPGTEQPGIYLLFSDGLATFGQRPPARFNKPLYAFSADPRANHRQLRSLATACGGAYFNLAEEDAAKAAATIGRPAASLMSVRATSGDIGSVAPGAGEARGRVLVTGQLLTERATVVLTYGLNGKAIDTRTFKIDGGNAAEGNLIRTWWAEQRIEELLAQPKLNNEQLVELGKQYDLVTPGTSLIVLETLDQYVRHRIRPPQSLADMQRQYDVAVSKLASDETSKNNQKLGHTLQLWNERIGWWDHTYSYKPDFHYSPDIGRDHNYAPESLSEPVNSARQRQNESDTAVMARSERLEQHELAKSAERHSQVARLASPAPVATAAAFPMAARSTNNSEDSQAAIAATIMITPWDPAVPYLVHLKESAASERYHAYLEERGRFGRSPAFFLDCADFFMAAGEKERAVRILSNIAELELENPALLRILAHRLEQFDDLDLSIDIFAEVLQMRPEDAISYRDLALVLARRGEAALKHKDLEHAKSDLQRAMELLKDIVVRSWIRGNDMELIALTEFNRLIPLAKSAGVERIPLEDRFVKKLDTDLRIVLTWDADLTDLDLWVTEPSGEQAYYGHHDTTIGGHVSRDVTDGYGPEEYMVKKAMKGFYGIEAKYYSDRNPALTGPATLQVEIITNFGRPNEQRQTMTRRLDKVGNAVKIGEIEIKND